MYQVYRSYQPKKSRVIDTLAIVGWTLFVITVACALLFDYIAL